MEGSGSWGGRWGWGVYGGQVQAAQFQGAKLKTTDSLWDPGFQGAETYTFPWGRSENYLIPTAGQEYITPRAHSRNTGRRTMELVRRRLQGSEQPECYSNQVAQYLVGTIRGGRCGDTHPASGKCGYWRPPGDKADLGDLHMA